MAPSVPTREPTSPVAGDSWKWDKTLGDYPASDGWQLSYYVRGPVDINLDWATEVTASGDTFQVRVEEAKTVLLTTVGAYELTGRVTDGTDTYTVVRCTINVQPNPVTAVNAKSVTLQRIEGIEAAILEAPDAFSVVKMTIHGRTTEFDNTAAARVVLASLKMQYELERNPHAKLRHAARMVTS